MTQSSLSPVITNAVSEKPLQASKFVGILFVLTLGVAGFFRILDAQRLIDGPALGDGQFLALIAIPIVSLALVCLVVVETFVTGYRVLRSDTPISEQASGRVAYILLRSAEAAVAVVGVSLMVAALPPLFAPSTPAPAGVGIMLLLFAVGIGILIVSFARSTAELFVYRNPS